MLPSGDPKRSITFEQAPGVAREAAPHPGRQLMRVDPQGDDPIGLPACASEARA
jgi:hypothetical protein